jgi:hypothetical protein
MVLPRPGPARSAGAGLIDPWAEDGGSRMLGCNTCDIDKKYPRHLRAMATEHQLLRERFDIEQ